MTYTGETQRLTQPTIHVLDDDQVWTKRENSALSILRIVFIAVFVFMFAALLITVTILGVISLVIQAGLMWYTSLAPFVLLAVIGYLYGKRRNE